MRVQVWERKPFATAGYNQRFIYSVFTKDTLDEKGQARDTSTHVTFNALKLDKEFSSRRWLKSPAARELDWKNNFPKDTFDLQKGLN